MGSPVLIRLATMLLAGLLPLCSGWANPLKTFEACQYVKHPANDGDSFMAKLGRETHMLRLYYVDCPEATSGAKSDRRRLLEQARYFGVPKPREVMVAGKQAAQRTQALLADNDFKVYTSFANAMGRSGKPRYFAMVELADGRDLAAVLVGEGLARARGIKRKRPDGTHSEEYGAQLSDLELTAALNRNGLWQHSRPDVLAAMRQKQREEDAALEGQALGLFNVVTPDNPLNLNTATPEELQSLKGVGEVLAQRIVEGRPYQRKEDLLNVDGIGPSLLKKIAPLIQTVPEPNRL